MIKLLLAFTLLCFYSSIVFATAYNGNDIGSVYKSIQNNYQTCVLEQANTLFEQALLSNSPKSVFNVSFVTKNGASAVSGTTVTLSGYGEKISDSEGKVVFEGVNAEENIKYSAFKAGFDEVYDSLSVIDADVSKIIYLNQLFYEVSFQVTAGGQPLAGARVTLGNYGTLTTGVDGKVTFANVIYSENIAYEISASGYGKATGSVAVTNQNVSKLVALEALTFNVKFVVKKGESAVENAKVTFQEQIQYTDASGETNFSNISSGYTLQYTVNVPGYSAYVSALNVIDQDVVEQVIFAIPSYNVRFEVHSIDYLLAGAEIALEGYGKKTTDKNGKAQFLNVESGVNIPYTITANWHDIYTGSIFINNQDITEVIQMTDINDDNTTQFQLWPNPTHNIITLQSNDAGQVYLFTADAKCVWWGELKYNSLEVPVSKYGTGVFILHFVGSHKVVTKRVIVQ